MAVHRKELPYLRLICAVLFTYGLLRAWFVAPQHDEITTFLQYVEIDASWWTNLGSENANNHLLNSWILRGIYAIAGENFFLFRLPNLIAFIFYFFAAYRLTLHIPRGKWIVFAALTGIPYLFEYFAYARGYGLAMAAFMWALVFLQDWLHTGKTRFVYAMVFALLLCLATNLIYMISAGLLIAYTIVSLLLQRERITGKKQAAFAGALLIYGIGLYPLLRYSFALKKAGALYYGSLDGFWAVTGKTLSRYVLLNDHDIWKIVFTVLAAGCALLWLLLLRRDGFRKTFRHTGSQAAFLVAGNTAAILFLAKAMQVNYPEDRAGMYFIPLCLLMYSDLVTRFEKLKYALLPLLYFPLTFLAHVSLNSSVFAPDDHFPERYYTSVRKHIHPGTSVSIYPLTTLSFPIRERHREGVPHIVNARREVLPYSDIIMTRSTVLTPETDLSAYRKIAEDPQSAHVAYKRIRPFRKTTLFDSLIPQRTDDGEFLGFFSGHVRDTWRKTPVELMISGDVQVQPDYESLLLVVSTVNTKGEPQTYDFVNLRWYSAPGKKNVTIHFPYAAGQFTASQNQLAVYLWNQDKKPVTLRNARLQVIALE